MNWNLFFLLAIGTSVLTAAVFQMVRLIVWLEAQWGWRGARLVFYGVLIVALSAVFGVVA